jgi:hypothetical protein
MSTRTVWQFRTARFCVALRIAQLQGYTYDGDDENGETQAKLDSGELVAFASTVSVEMDGAEIATDTLHGSIYAISEVHEFWTAHRDPNPDNRNTLAMRQAGRSIAHYFPDMVRNAIADAKAHIRGLKANAERLPYIRPLASAAPLWQREFPDYPADAMPALPEGWTDQSWHNNACPSFLHDASGLSLWVDYPEPGQREHATARRFLLSLCSHRDPVHGWQSTGDDTDCFATDDWAALLRSLPHFQSEEYRQSVGLAPAAIRSTCERYGLTERSTGGGCMAYGLSGLGDVWLGVTDGDSGLPTDGGAWMVCVDHDGETRLCEDGFSAADLDAALGRARAEFDRLGAVVVERVARAFADNLRRELGAARMATVIAANKTVAPGVCASHDYCDANMPMAAAFETVMGREPDASADADATLWSRAWDMAREAEFWNGLPLPLAALTAEYQTWLDAMSLPLLAAEDLEAEIGAVLDGGASKFIPANPSPPRRAVLESARFWLGDFLARWNAADDGAPDGSVLAYLLASGNFPLYQPDDAMRAALAGMPLDSGCGEDCKTAIDAASAVRWNVEGAMGPHPEYFRQLAHMTAHTCRIYICG